MANDTQKDRQIPTKDKTIIASIIMTNNFMVQRIVRIFIFVKCCKETKITLSQVNLHKVDMLFALFNA